MKLKKQFVKQKAKYNNKYKNAWKGVIPKINFKGAVPTPSVFLLNNRTLILAFLKN